MMITPLQLKTVFPQCHDPNAWCRIFAMELPAFEIDSPLRIAAWVAQCGYESQSFNTLRESGAYGRKIKLSDGRTSYDVYSEKRLMALWPHKFPTLESTQPYIQQPEALLNYVYAGVDGNGPPESRDGFIYRGGGLIQLTGRANYAQVGKALNLPLESLPKMIETPSVAARAAGYFWKIHDLNAAADAGDFEYITRKINPALDALAERTAYYAKALAQLKVPSRKGIAPGPGFNPPKPAPSPGPRPGPVTLGTQDGKHTPNSFNNLQDARDIESGRLAAARDVMRQAGILPQVPDEEVA